jgi:hypothetical protein
MHSKVPLIGHVWGLECAGFMNAPVTVKISAFTKII